MKKIMMILGVVTMSLSAWAAGEPEVKFTFDDYTKGEPTNEGSAEIGFMGSYSTYDYDGAAVYAKSLMGYGIHSYSPWCNKLMPMKEDTAFSDNFTVELCFRGTTVTNNILLCLGNLNDPDADALLVTTESASSIKLVVVRYRMVIREVSVPIVGTVEDYHICFLRYAEGKFTANMDGEVNGVSIECGKPKDVFQILGGYDKQNEMADYPHGCGAVDTDKSKITEPNPDNVIDDLRIWRRETLTDEEIKAFLESFNVKFLDWDEEAGQTTNAVLKAGSYTKVTSHTRTLVDGWNVVLDDVIINDGANIAVNEHAKLILCDNASLTISNVEEKNAAIKVLSGRALTIYGQEKGSGKLVVTGGTYGAGIGGGWMDEKHGGMLTINGGIVEANGGEYGAGIGGGDGGNGGTTKINRGTVTVIGGHFGAGIGGGYAGTGEAVIISGGAIKVTAGYGNAGVGYYSKTVHAAVFGRGADSSAESDGIISITGGIFGMEITKEWCAKDYGVVANPDSSTSDKYPYMVDSVCWVTIGEYPNLTAKWTSGDGSKTNEVEGMFFTVGKGTTNVKVIFAPTPSCYISEGDEVVEIGTVEHSVSFGEGSEYQVPKSVQKDIPYLGWDETKGEFVAKEIAGGSYTVVTENTRTLVSGWNVVADDVYMTNARLAAKGQANLIICDGASLTVFGDRGYAAIAVVASDNEYNELTIYGQELGTGKLSVTGGISGAGIGGSSGDSCGAITIYGGAIKAEAGSGAEVFGRGWYGASDGTIKLCGGVFGMELKDAWIPEGKARINNEDEATKEDYPHRVGEAPKWEVGKEVEATVNGLGRLHIYGIGEMEDFASADKVPWDSSTITYVIIDDGVSQIGKNALAGMADTVTVNGTKLSTYRTVTEVATTINGMALDAYNEKVRYLNVGEEWKTGPASSGPTIPEGMMIVAKEAIQAPKVGTMKVENSEVTLGVSVGHTDDITLDEAQWPKMSLEKAVISRGEDNKEILIKIPVNTQSGFMLLKSSDKKLE